MKAAAEKEAAAKASALDSPLTDSTALPPNLLWGSSSRPNSGGKSILNPLYPWHHLHELYKSMLIEVL